MLRTALPALAAALLVSAVTAQNDKAIPITVPIVNAGVYHVSSGTWEPPTEENPEPGSTIGTVIYCNDAPQGYFLRTNYNSFVGDYGRIPGTLSPPPEVGTRLNYRITGFEFAYCTRKVTGTFGYLIGFHPNYKPCANETLPSAAGSVTLHGLPGSQVKGDLHCFRVTVDMRWSKEFCMWSDGGEGVWDDFALTDSFGFTLWKTPETGFGGGPILAGDPTGLHGPPAPQGDGTFWHGNVGEPGTGLGTADQYYVKMKYGEYPQCKDVVNQWDVYGSFHLKLYADMTSPPCGNSFSTLVGSTYCDPAVSNSNTYPGEIIATGSSVYADANFTLWAANLPPKKNAGYFLMGDAQTWSLPPGSAGPLCVGGGGLTRIMPSHYASDNLGGFSQNISLDPAGYWNLVGAGSTWNFQAWYRDKGGPSNLTNAVSVTFE